MQRGMTKREIIEELVRRKEDLKEEADYIEKEIIVNP